MANRRGSGLAPGIALWKDLPTYVPRKLPTASMKLTDTVFVLSSVVSRSLRPPRPPSGAAP